MSEQGMNGKIHSDTESVTTNKTNSECAKFQEQLPGLMGDGADFSTEPHLETCANCSELVRDLQYIAQQAKLLLPLHDPSPAVWQKIESSLQANDDEPSPGKKK
jgi:hypothetical protein